MARHGNASTRNTGIALAIAALTFLGPVVILGFWAYCEIIAKKGATNPELASQNAEFERGMADLEERRSAVSDEGDEAGLSRRADGAFDERSGDGRALNRRIASLDERYAAVAGVLYKQNDGAAKLKGARVAAGALVFVFAVVHTRMPNLGAFQATIASAVALLAGFFAYKANGNNSPQI